MKGSTMIETVCKIPSTKVDYFEYECKKCKNVMRFGGSIGLVWACPICSHTFSKEDLAYLDAIKAIAHFQKEDNHQSLSFHLNFVSVERGA